MSFPLSSYGRGEAWEGNSEGVVRIESAMRSRTQGERLMADTPRPDDKRQDEVANDPKWDRKQGTPKDQKTAKTVERASSRYSASEQSEEKKKSRGQG